jgi:hypothetical protein
MGQINVSRLLAMGLVTGIIVALVEDVANGVFRGARWNAGLAGLGRTPLALGDITLFNLWALVIGFAAAWIYVGFRPRFGPGPRTATYAALTVWVIGYFLRYAVMWMLGMPAGLMAIAGAAALVGTVVAATVGMHVYQEP